MKDSFRELIQQKALVGTWSIFRDPQVFEVLASAGMDFVIVDMEHGSASFSEAQSCVMALQAVGAQALIRVPDSREESLLRALEIGVDAVVVPQIRSLEQARAITNAIYYFPQGRRGFSPYTRSGGYYHFNDPQFSKRKNDNTACVLLIEGESGFEDLQAISELEGVDVIYFGTYDLSHALGVPGEIQSSRVQDYVRDGLKLIKKNGKAAGILCQSPRELIQRKEMGFNFICYQADCALLYESVAKGLGKSV